MEVLGTGIGGLSKRTENKRLEDWWTRACMNASVKSMLVRKSPLLTRVQTCLRVSILKCLRGMYWFNGRRLRTGRSSPVFLGTVKRRERKPEESGWTSSIACLEINDRISRSMAEASWRSVGTWYEDRAWMGGGLEKGM